jgi:hypothetical protein
LLLLAWIYGWIIQEKYPRNPPSWDWVDPEFVEGFFVLVFRSKSFYPQSVLRRQGWADDSQTDFSKQSLQNWLYYVVST